MKYFKSGRATEGMHKAVVMDVTTKPNEWSYDPSKDDGPKNVPEFLTILFQLENGAQHYQNFVSPICDYGLFSDLLSIGKIDFNSDGGDIDPRNLEGIECEIELIQNDKGYLNCQRAWAIDTTKGNPNATEEERELASQNTKKN